MTKEDILDRLIGERLGIGVYELAKTVNRERVAEQVAKIEKNINDLDLCILDTLYDIEDIEMRLKIENKNRKIDVVFVDFIQLVRNKESKSKYESLSEVSEKLQELAKELGVCMVILSQISNEAQKDDNYRELCPEERRSSDGVMSLLRGKKVSIGPADTRRNLRRKQ